MIDLFPFVFLCLIAAVVGFLCWYEEDRRRWKRVRKMAEDDNYWCEKACIYHRQCHEKHDDPDDVWAELQEYCSRCPMMCAVEMYEEQNK